MKQFIALIVILLACISLKAQTAQRVIGTPTLPAHCQAGPNPQVYIDTNATTTAQFYVCTSTNHWTAQGGGGGTSAIWGLITGTLSNQTDLQTALNLKVATTRTISTTSPLAGGGDLSGNLTLSIANAVADGSTKGAATFTASDFNASSGNISIDYTNGQAASSGTKGFLTAADWTTFNSKGSGTVTSIATTSPITGGTITGTGTIACATCTTSAASLTSTALVTGAGSQGLQTPAATATMNGSGNISTPGSVATGVGSGVAGNIGYGQGTATGVAANTIQIQAPSSVTGWNFIPPSAAGDGVMVGSNSSNVVTFSFVATSGTGSILRQTGSPYDPAFLFTGAPSNSQTLRMVASRAFDSAASFAGTVCSAGTAATAQSDFLVKKNGSTVATLRFAASGTTCSIVTPSTTAFAAGDVLTIVAPSSADATLADVAISILGTLH